MVTKAEKNCNFTAMITPEELSILTRPEVRQTIAEARGRDPLEVALDSRIPHARLVATQVKYLARAERKLPSYAAAQCILPPRAFEQASSEACAATKQIAGDTVLDLTCGLGVDARALSSRFRQVVTLERDPVLAQVARENFARLGITNVEVVCCSAEEYLTREGLYFDWIYADPDRRGTDGLKKVRMEDCSPNIVTLLPRLREIAPRICIKNSPLFDVDEAQRIFDKCRVEVLSIADECKEVVIYADGSGPQITATALGKGSFTAQSDEKTTPLPPPTFCPERYGWLVIPDVALQKARLARLHLHGKADIWNENGFGFATEEPHDILGRVMAIDGIEPYDPKRLKHTFKGCKAEIFKRDFPIATEEIMRRLGMRAGSEIRVACTKIGDDYWLIRLK